jgi:hypothetical protein
VALVIFAACGGLMVVGAWYAGESVYTQGVAVHMPDATAETKPAGARNLEDTIIFYVGEPVQLHMIGAGVVFALAMASLGLSIRKITAEYPDAIHLPLMPEPSSSDAGGLLPLTDEHPRTESPLPQFSSPHDLPEEPFVPAGRFWLIAALAALFAAVGGYWVWANGSSEWAPHAFWTDVMSTRGQLNFDRAAVHVWIGVSLIVLPLILAALSRWAPRQRIVLGIFGLLLVLAISAQVLLGVLLQFDGATGPLYRFSPPDKGSAQLTPAQGEGSTLSRSSV